MLNNCWNQIGVQGDSSCSKLQTHIHCRNCPVYSTTGRHLLEREADADYVNEWTRVLAQEKVVATRQLNVAGTLSVAIFRLGSEWLALPAHLFKEVTPPCSVRTLPHRSNKVFLGLVNIRGEIQVCISLTHLLGLETASLTLSQRMSHVIYQRMVVVEKEENIWVFAVDEMYGVHRIALEELTHVPATVAKASQTYTKHLIKWQDKNVNYLDEELIFYTLGKKYL